MKKDFELKAGDIVILNQTGIDEGYRFFNKLMQVENASNCLMSPTVRFYPHDENDSAFNIPKSYIDLVI